MTSDPRADTCQLCRAGTFALAPGQLTGSELGQGVAPLLGSLSEHDESITSGCFGFLSYAAAMCDYALLITYVPQSVSVTNVVLKFLLRSDAQEGAARGVATRGYVPGPYSELEQTTADFVDRYLQLLR